MTLQMDTEEGTGLAGLLAEENRIPPEEAPEQLAGRIIREALSALGCPYEAEVNLLVTGPDRVQELNRQFRGLDQTTDVLSFPMLVFEQPGDFSFLEEDEESFTEDCFNPETGELLLGDIVLNEDRVISQAGAYGHSVTREYAFLITHSILHLCGYDHMTAEQEEEMQKKQEEILSILGISRNEHK